MTQEQFCACYGLNFDTYISWENGRRSPVGTSAVYLQMIKLDPKVVAQLVKRLERQQAQSAQTA